MQWPSDGDQPDRIIVGGAFSLVLLISFLCFIPDLRNDFLWDDIGYIVENTHIRQLTFETISWAFIGFYLNYWAPLTWLSLGLDYALWGLNPVGYHLTNNLLHALNAGIFFLLSLELFRSYLAARTQQGLAPHLLTPKRALYCSLLAALYFAVHPLRVESVVWASERKDVLSMFFGILAALFYVKHAQAQPLQGPPFAGPRAKPLYYRLTVAFFCLSLMSKILFVTLPLVLLVLDWFPLHRLTKRTAKGLIREKMPLLGIAGFVSLVTMMAHAATIMSFEEAGLASRVLNALKSIMMYLKLTLWPAGLSPFYLHPLNIGQLSPEHTAAIIFFIALSISCALLVRRQPVFLASWLIYLLTLLPFLGIAQSGSQSMADRFTYLPALPVSLLAALGVTAAHARASASRTAHLSVLSAVVLMLSINAYLTVRQITFWKDDVTLWTRAIDLEPHSTGRAYYQRAYAYLGRDELDKALADTNEALTIASRKNYRDTQDIYYLRARIFKRKGDYGAALADYGTAISQDSSSHRRVYYRERGGLYRELGRNDLADQDFRMAEALAREYGLH